MKKLSTIILLSIFSVSMVASAEASGTEYVSEDSSYSFALPDNWEEIPKSTIDALIQEVADANGTLFVDFASGFQMEQEEYFQYPYMLIREVGISTPSYQLIMDELLSDNFEETLKKEFEDYEEMALDGQLKTPVFDEDKNAFFMDYDVKVTNIGPVKGFSVFFSWKGGLS